MKMTRDHFEKSILIGSNGTTFIVTQIQESTKRVTQIDYTYTSIILIQLRHKPLKKVFIFLFKLYTLLPYIANTTYWSYVMNGSHICTSLKEIATYLRTFQPDCVQSNGIYKWPQYVIYCTRFPHVLNLCQQPAS